MKSIHLVSLLLSLLICNPIMAKTGEPQDSVILRADWKKLKTKEYSLSYPSNWILNQDKTQATHFTLYAPGPKAVGSFEKNINLSIQDLSDRNLNLDKYTTLSERQIHTLVENSELLESTRIDTLEVPFHEIIYTGDYYEQKLKWKMRFWVVKDQVYILTYTASKETFGLYSKIAGEIMDTFRLK